MARYTKAEREESIAALRGWLKPGDTVHCIVRHVSRSGMSRRISLLKIMPDGSRRYLSGSAACALGWGWSTRDGHDAVRVDGCGMDMCFHVVYSLAHAIFRADDPKPRKRMPGFPDGAPSDRGYWLRAEVL